MAIPPVRQIAPAGLTRDAPRLADSDEFLRSRPRELLRDVENVGKRRLILSKRLLTLKRTAASLSFVMLREMVLGR